MHTAGKGKHRVQLEIRTIGEDILLILTGGEQPHLGGTVVYSKETQPSMISLGSHKDHLVLQPLAEKVYRKYQKTVIAVGGIHIDHATSEDIDCILRNCKEIESCI